MDITKIEIIYRIKYTRRVQQQRRKEQLCKKYSTQNSMQLFNKVTRFELFQHVALLNSLKLRCVDCFLHKY